MIKTSNGNNTMSYDEFVESLKKLGVDTSLSNTESWKETYNFLYNHGTIYEISEINYTYKFTQDLLARIQKEYGEDTKLYYVTMGHDVPADSWCTQDVLYDYVIVLSNNEIRSYLYEGYKKYQAQRKSK